MGIVEYLTDKDGPGWLKAAVLLYLLIWLAILSVRDIRFKKIPLPMLLAGSIPFLANIVYEFSTQGGCLNWILRCAVGLLPGLLLIILGMASKKVGRADGIVLCVAGSVLGYAKGLAMLCAAVLILAILSMILLAFKKISKKTQMPFIPFLAAGYLVCILIR